jgi:hypothetical protein
VTRVGSRRTLIAAIAVVSVAACSGGDDDAATTDPPAPATLVTSTEPLSTTEFADDEDPDSDTSTTGNPLSDDAPADDAPAATVALVDGFEATIELLTPVAGSGIRPLLEWSPLDSAFHYMAILYAPDSSPYWTWTTAATSVHVGGEPVLDDDRPGPSVIEGMTWGIVALDDELVPIAYSERRSIAP